MRANPKVREDIGKVALMRGPVVYCLEEADNGPDLHLFRLGEQPDFKICYQPDLLDGIMTVRASAQRLCPRSWEDGELYASGKSESYEEKELLWIPYYAWANRQSGELMVWIRKTSDC